MKAFLFLVALTLCVSPITSNSFAQGTWKIKTILKFSSPMASGTITPYDSVTHYVEVANGADITFTITPGPGCRIASMMAGNNTVYNSESYTFYNVTHDDSIRVRFEVNPRCYTTPDTCYVCRDSSVIPWTLLGFDLGVCDTFRFGEPVCVNYTGTNAIAVGDSFKVPFYVYNDYPIGGFSLGFRNTGKHVHWGKGWEVDANSSIPVAARPFKTPTDLSADRDTVLIGWTDPTAHNPIPATLGNRAVIVGSLYVVVEATSPDTFRIDSTFVLPAGPFILIAILSPSANKRLTPRYVPAEVHIVPECFGNPGFLCGDANSDSSVDIADAVYLIQYIFADGPAPNPLEAGDANCDSEIDIADAVYLIQYIFANGPTPCEECK